MLTGAGIDVPGRVRFESVNGVVRVRRAEEGEEGAQMVSKVGQVVTPSWVMQTLGVSVGGAVYARSGSDAVIELVASTRVRISGSSRR